MKNYLVTFKAQNELEFEIEAESEELAIKLAKKELICRGSDGDDFIRWKVEKVEEE